MNAIILAGSQPIKSWSESGNKALFKINDKMMIDYVIDALRGVSGIGRVAVVGPSDELGEHLAGKVDRIIDPQGSIMDNLMAGVKYLGTDDYLLICSCDIPLVTTESLNDFISSCRKFDGDFFYPLVRKEANDIKYPEVERTYIKTLDGIFTGANIFLINPAILEERFVIADNLLKARKNPVKMAKLLSFGFLIRLITGTLSLSKAEKRFSKLMNIKAKVIVSDYPEISIDVDKPSDVIVATAHLVK